MNTFQYAGIICNLIALSAIASSLMVVGQAVKNPVNAVLWLIVAFVAAAGYLVTAGMTFLGLSYIIVYVGAIAVLFLFVVMMLNIAATAPTTAIATTNASNWGNMWPVAILIVGIGLLMVVPMTDQWVTPIVELPAMMMDIAHTSLWSNTNTSLWSGSDTVGSLMSVSVSNGGHLYNLMDLDNGIGPLNQMQSLGMTLYVHGVLWLMIISILLMLAMLVPLALAFTA